MWICEPSPEDWPGLRALARSLGLEYGDMESDRFWIARDGGRVVGLVGLKRHPDCLELVSLGVEPDRRSQGLGRALVETLFAAAGQDVYLATVIPEYFQKRGFRRASAAPAGMAKDPAWCEGCPKERCTIMVRPSP